MKSATNLTASTHHLIQTYLVVAVIYVVINLLLSRLAHRLERGRKRGGSRPATARAVEAELTPNAI